MQKISAVGFLFLFAGIMTAQSSPPATVPLPPGSIQAITLQNFQMQVLTRTAADGSMEEQRRADAKREAEFEQTQFREKANHFVELWLSFANKLNERQTFDAKLAGKLSKAFHELEKSDGWPIREAAK